MRLALALLLHAPAASAQEAPTLELRIQGVASTAGRILVAVFDRAEGFPGRAELAVHKVAVPAAVPTTTVRVEGLEAGRYAVVAVHDVNDNGALDVRAIIPIPKEPTGASRDARGRFGPPRFDDAVFELPPQGVHAESFSLVSL
ncbi:MAG: DUF2141 domain-containing protein [Alphaproteobacteria bacterium]|nr:DUF2141 domain-containing protein [Alphaproteobacteria bacterium]